MARKKSKAVEIVDETPASDPTKKAKETWVPTRAAYLANNPYAHMTKDEVQARLDVIRLPLQALQDEYEHLINVLASFHMAYTDAAGVVRIAE